MALEVQAHRHEHDVAGVHYFAHAVAEIAAAAARACEQGRRTMAPPVTSVATPSMM